MFEPWARTMENEQSPPPVDLGSFGPWQWKPCEMCDIAAFTTGPPDGPFRCKTCWLQPGVEHRPRRHQDEALFDRDAYRKPRRQP